MEFMTKREISRVVLMAGFLLLGLGRVASAETETVVAQAEADEASRKENQDPLLQSEPRENAQGSQAGQETLTATDQSNAPEDLALTQQIRQALVSDPSLSMEAKNLQVITVGRKVTLRGPVKTAAEKSLVENLANGIAGTGRVNSQIEVAPAR